MARAQPNRPGRGGSPRGPAQQAATSGLSPRSRRLATVALVALAVAASLILGVYLRIDVTRHLDPGLRPYVVDGEDRPYPYTEDSFLFSRQSRNVLDHGHAGDRLVEGRSFDSASFAPGGRPANGGLLPRLQAGAFQLARVLVPGASLAAVSFYLPALASALTALVCFLLGWQLCRRRAGAPPAPRGLPALCGLLAALLASVHPELISHCQAGILDTTYLNLLFFALTAWLYLRALDLMLEGTFKQRPVPAVLFGTAALGSLLLFRWTWLGYQAVALLITVHLGLVLLYKIGQGQFRLGPLARLGRRGAAALAGGVLAVAALLAWQLPGSRLWLRLRAYSRSDDTSFFPQGIGEVSELVPLDVPTLIAWLGGPPFLLAAALGLWLGLRRFPSRALVFVLLWLAPTLVAGYLSRRFLVFAVLPAALLAALGLAGSAQWVAGRLRRKKRPEPVWLRVTIALVAALLLALSFGERFRSFQQRRPAVDRAVVETAQWIRERAAPDAVINTWWDAGYIYADLAGRGVILDGASFQNRRLYWFAHALTTSDPRRSLGLLRLIDCGEDGVVYDELRSLTDGRRALALMQRGAELSGEGAAAVEAHLVGAGLPPDAARGLARRFACQPPEGWLVISSAWMGKTTSWARYGLWHEGPTPPPPKGWMSAELACDARAGLFTCGEYRADPRQPGWQDHSAPGYFAAQGPPRPDGWVPVLYQVGRQVALVFVHQEILDSLFVRLYFFRGQDLPAFQLDHQAAYPPYTQRVLAFRLRW